MSRSLAFILAAATLSGCSATPEQPLLQQFFAASRLRDRTALAGFAEIVFEPATDGIVTTFTITSVSEEQGGPTARKQVSISAPVKLPNGQTAQKNFVVTIQRAASKADAEINERWIVTGIKEASGAAATPRS
jgi:hypothetical protein